MKIDINTVITDLKGNPILNESVSGISVLQILSDNPNDKGIKKVISEIEGLLKNITLGEVIYNSCTADIDSDKDLKYDQKKALIYISKNIINSVDFAELSAEEIVLIKERINKVYVNKVIIVQSIELLS